MSSESKNPWLVSCIDSFNFLCCPECVYRSKEETTFQVHALQNHPRSQVFFNPVPWSEDQQVKTEQEGSIEKSVVNEEHHDPIEMPVEVKLEPAEEQNFQNNDTENFAMNNAQ